MPKIIATLILSGISLISVADPFAEKLVQAAIERTRHQIIYNGSYQKIAYPNGDVAADRGVCTDVIIRSYRKLGIDLQKDLHEDIRNHFDLYPSKRIWGHNKPDTNIDHRRVPNLQVFFSRKGQTLTISQNPEDYRPGDLVTWKLPGNLPHIGIVTDQIDPHSGNLMVVHNIGAGPQLDDSLFAFTLTGHYRYQKNDSDLKTTL
ncbi:DUF1287 domain-containing protein [Teredinibacter haidensis]|uniref:DUF1287 domain-containing protein n=1 Tax=Teredinibacter haidensis TaxID=2731755 RepID=UPI0009491220|nr:DUF1287 domain-containing protein [Teredinibacter haidensis]